ncbi:MAG TPA: glutamate cyclase domain-containing protein, partial [Pirellulales bacterium]
MPLDFSALEAIVRQDPSGRGVAGYRHDGQWLAAGMLERAARDLAERGDAVAIVTGFCVADLDPPMAETDGPPGALYLARALLALGKKVALVSDGSGLDLLRLGCRLWNLDAPLIDLAAATGDRRPALGEVLPWPIAERLT